ncbi:MAG TPA: hypothetical protein ENK31_03915, partial [Nannocystis exedens]|nr:hypothetical protein [Nannocystis exedens]
MQRLSKAMITVLTALTLSFSGCSKSVEGESKRWQANTATVNTLEAQYPGLKGALEARKANADRIFAAAKDLKGDAKIDKLAEANSTLMSGFVRDLQQIDEKIKKLRESRALAATNAGDTASRRGAELAAADAAKVIEQAQAMLERGAADEDTAKVLIKKASDDLDAAQEAIDKVIAAAKSKKDSVKADKAAEKSDAKAEEAAAAAKVAPWKCSYCDSENPHDVSSCNSCGAPRKT